MKPFRPIFGNGLKNLFLFKKLDYAKENDIVINYAIFFLSFLDKVPIIIIITIIILLNNELYKL